MPQPSLHALAPSRVRSTAMRSVPPCRADDAERARAAPPRPASASAAGLLIVTDLANVAASIAGHLAEHDQFGQRIRAQPVGAVDADARAFADRIQARQRRRRLAVGEDAAHRVMHRRQHRNRRRAPDRRRGIPRPARRSAAGARAVSSRRGGAGRDAPPRRAAPSIVRPFCFSCQNAWLRRSRGPELHRLVARLRLGRARGRSPAGSDSRPC